MLHATPPASFTFRSLGVAAPIGNPVTLGPEHDEFAQTRPSDNSGTKRALGYCLLPCLLFCFIVFAVAGTGAAARTVNAVDDALVVLRAGDWSELALQWMRVLTLLKSLTLLALWQKLTCLHCSKHSALLMLQRTASVTSLCPLLVLLTCSQSMSSRHLTMLDHRTCRSQVA